ncbi:cryptochrome/photolyase family protein [Ruegeria marina]|uniref:Deoxyribodipyrimidine photo-lyase n=1 Tax=Ruegeria marina TaxID=639004 RepID=A0A1G6XU09_9RHOB|nr:deoxyribodipyrimidine photo-lyase [Ruegeria marina]SDD80836.1 deoxyribodipyrimidine photo-lyase [Ruegeria marina]
MTQAKSPIIFWFRRDLRLADHPGFSAACATGRPVIPVFVHDGRVEALGAAPRFRLGLGLAAFADSLNAAGSRLILRRGDPLAELRALLAETGAGAVWWSRLYDPASIAQDQKVKAALRNAGCDARSFAGHLLFEPWTVETGTGGFYKVYSPFWRAVRGIDVAPPVPVPTRLPVPSVWPGSDRLESWHMDAAMGRGGAVVARYQSPGEEMALRKLDVFVDKRIDLYKQDRDNLDAEATSGLSDHLSLGEIGPRTLWHRGQEAIRSGAAGAEHFLKELVWREFAYHLMYHSPHILDRNWRAGWETFPWSEDRDNPGFVAWCRGRTGEPLVDAAMREMYVTGRMHNRARMVAASFLTKHLMVHWKLGMDWFADCLTDWDPASNAMGWQWVAGCGPDAAPFFRVFNPETQAAKFDAGGAYRKRWIAEAQKQPPQTALDFFSAIPRAWMLDRDASPAQPVVSLEAGRKRALAAYSDQFSTPSNGKLA